MKNVGRTEVRFGEGVIGFVLQNDDLAFVEIHAAIRNVEKLNFVSRKDREGVRFAVEEIWRNRGFASHYLLVIAKEGKPRFLGKWNSDWVEFGLLRTLCWCWTWKCVWFAGRIRGRFVDRFGS